MSDARSNPESPAAPAPGEDQAARGLAPERHFRLAEAPSAPDLGPGGVTILFGGLTESHERLVEGAWEGLGLRVRGLPIPDNESLALGREYGNRGMCNPAYYTIGSIVYHLRTT